MRALHYGAGNIGRGFIGLLLARSGYEVTFVDVNEQIVRLLQERRAYPVRIADHSQREEWVRGVTAIHGQAEQEVADAAAASQLITTAVGVHILPHLAKVLAEGIRRKQQHPLTSNQPLYIIACENALNGSSILEKEVYQHLTAEEQDYARTFIRFPNSAVDRIVPAQQHEDPLMVTVEPYYEWVVDRSGIQEKLPIIDGIHYVNGLEPYISRKLFTVNTGHACAAYFGYLKGYRTIQEAMADEAIMMKVRGALNETGELLHRLYGFDREEHQSYIRHIIARFQNPMIIDDVVRVGRSPIRKLSPQDRFVKPAMQAHALGIETPYLIEAIAAALHFDEPTDREAVELQQQLAGSGVQEVISHILGIAHDHPLHNQILKQVERMNAKGGHQDDQ